MDGPQEREIRFSTALTGTSDVICLLWRNTHRRGRLLSIKTEPGKNDMTNSSNNQKSKNNTFIGESIVIVGDINGKDDITVNGAVEGEIILREHDIYVGETGRINANMTAKNISVEGDVKGELKASTQVRIKPSGRVTGDIKAPRVILDDGCQFKGSVDMEEMHTADSRNPKLKLAGNKTASGPQLKAKKPAKS